MIGLPPSSGGDIICHPDFPHEPLPKPKLYVPESPARGYGSPSFSQFPFLEKIWGNAGSQEILDALIASPPLLESPDRYGRTPLIVASCYASAEVVELLLKLGANIEAKSRDARTPLLHATRRGDANIVEILLSKGANKAAQDNVGFNAFSIALLHGHASLLTLLRPIGDINDSSNTTLKFADIFAQVATHQGFSRACSIAEVFQSLGGDISAPGLGIDAPLQYCIQFNQSDSVLRLLRLGANINCIGLDGRIVGENTAGTLAEAVNFGWDLFVEKLKQISPTTLISLLPPDMLRLVVSYLRPRPALPDRSQPEILDVD